MNTRTKRTVVATAALAAAGLLGSLPFDGSSVAQQGVPTVHRDVALVDIVTDEISFDNLVYTDLTSGETSLYTAVADATTPADAALLLGAGTAPDYFDNLFDVFEYLGALIVTDDRMAQGEGWVCGWFGKWAYADSYGTNAKTTMKSDRDRLGAEWPCIKAGIFTSLERFDEVYERHQKDCASPAWG